MKAPPPPSGKIRILVAEDDHALRRLLELRLTVDGYEVRTVVDGAEAIALAETWAPDIFVCDVMMPRVSGLSACRAIRAMDQFVDLPIILLTARVFDEDIESVMRLGGITFMNKPFNAAELNQTLLQILGDPSAPQAKLSWLTASPPHETEAEVVASRTQPTAEA